MLSTPIAPVWPTSFISSEFIYIHISVFMYIKPGLYCSLWWISYFVFRCICIGRYRYVGIYIYALYADRARLTHALHFKCVQLCTYTCIYISIARCRVNPSACLAHALIFFFFLSYLRVDPMYIYIYLYLYIYIYIYIYLFIYLYIYIYIYVYIYIYIYIHIYIYIYIYDYIYMHIYISG